MFYIEAGRKVLRDITNMQSREPFEAEDSSEVERSRMDTAETTDGISDWFGDSDEDSGDEISSIFPDINMTPPGLVETEWQPIDFDSDLLCNEELDIDETAALRESKWDALLLMQVEMSRQLDELRERFHCMELKYINLQTTTIEKVQELECKIAELEM